MRVLNILTFGVGLGAVPSVVAWGAAGHEIVATIAQMYLDPSVFPALCHLLNYTSPDPTAPLCHLAPVSTWADRVRFKMPWSSGLHYINALDDHPSQTCQFPGERGWAGGRGNNLFSGIKNVTGILEDWSDGSADDARASEALKFLIHFLGDMHMPLHLAGRDKGGNLIKVHFDGRLSNLHSVWDGKLIAKAIRTVPGKYNRPLPYPRIEHALRGTIYDAYVRQIMAEGILGAWKSEFMGWLQCPKKPSNSDLQTVISSGVKLSVGGEEFDDEFVCPYHWALPTHALNCEIIWPAAIDEPPYNTSRLLEDKHGRDHVETHQNDIEFTNPRGTYLELDTPEYAGVIAKRMLIEKLLAQGGIRLAGILNMLFADRDEL